MRDIKFRAWVNGKMVTPFLWINESNLPCNQCCGSPKVPLMQFTGIFDKNGNEIYEGDIVEVTETDTENSFVTNVRRNGTALIIDIAGNTDFDMTCIDWAQDSCSYEYLVIGNIHETKELLK